MQNKDYSSKRKQDQISKTEKRTHCVSVRLNPAELSELDAHRGKFQRGEALRMSALTGLPQQLPSLSLDTFLSLGKGLNNINQIAKKLNSGDAVELDVIRTEITELRNAILNAKGNLS